jgi:signal transduction histidine kinase/CHASE3 domain sensor protein
MPLSRLGLLSALAIRGDSLQQPDAAAFQKELRRITIVPITALVLAGLILCLAILGLSSRARWVDHTDRVIASANMLQMLMIDEETGVRGYLITHDPATLEPWTNAHSQIGNQFDTLALLIHDNPYQQQQLSRIRARHSVWQKFAEGEISTQSQSVEEGRRQMDLLRLEIREFRDTEETLRATRSNESGGTLFAILSGLFAACITFALGLKRWLSGKVASLNRVRQAELQELQDKTELIELAQLAVYAGYWYYYPPTGLCYLSPSEQQIFGLHDNTRPLIGEIMDRIYPAVRERFALEIERGMHCGVYSVEFRTYKEDTTLQWIAGQGRVLKTEAGEAYMVSVNFNVSGQKLAEEALRKSEKLAVAGRLAATIAHEINNPLESVTNLLYLARTSTTDAVIGDYLSTAEEELARVAQIVTYSLKFHRQSSVPTFEIVSNILDSAAVIYRTRLMLNRVEIKRDYLDETSVRCYSSELRQVFSNLIGNAFDAIPDGGTIYLRTREAYEFTTRQRGVRISVADTGHGMDANTMHLISEPFYTTKGLNGSGLGLWISRDIIKKHRGTLAVRSRQDGAFRGTLFSVFLPFEAIPELAHTPQSLSVPIASLA